MTADLILFRHGQAENPGSEKDDFHRVLTQNGIDALKKNMVQLRTLLRADQTTYLWCSPLLRAKQTAEILAEELTISEWHCFDWIGDGDGSHLSSELEKLVPPFNLIVVGHEPYLSDWSSKICGCKVPFQKGAAACFNLVDLKTPSGILEWICWPEPRIKENRPAGKQTQSFLIYCLQEIIIAQKQFELKPDNADSVHHLRVKIRQFRSLLSFFEPLLDSGTCEEIQNQMKRQSGALADLRRLDVLAEAWEGFRVRFTDHAISEDTFSKSLQKERNLQITKMSADHAAEQSRKACSSLLPWLLDESWDSIPDRSFRDFSEKQMKKWGKESRKEFLHADLSSLESVHAVRIKLKKLRYASKILGSPLGKRIKIPFDLEEMLDLLGEYIDAKTGILLLEELRLKYKLKPFQYQSGILTGYYSCRAEQLREELISKRSSIN